MSQFSIDEEAYEYLCKEASIAAINLCEGLNGLRKASVTQKASYYKAFFGLSIGLERLLKLLLLLNIKSKTGSFPNNKDLRRYSHSILKTFEDLSSEFTSLDGYKELKDDPIHLSILSVLQDFAEQSRYSNLDYLTGKRDTEDPINLWYQNVAKVILIRHFKGIDKQVLASAEKMEHYAHVNFTDEEGAAVRSVSDLFLKSKHAETLRKHSVAYVGAILNYLVEILWALERRCTQAISLHEFFGLFHQPRKFFLGRKVWDIYRL